MKQCNKCLKIKQINQFNNNGKYGIYSQCKECEKAKKKILYQTEKYKIKNRERTKTKEYRKIVSIRRSIRKKTEPKYKLVCNLRTRIKNVLKGTSKSRKTLELLGCSLESFKEYLESKFQPGMTWENYGYYGWHIDHIIPCASFDLTNPEEQRKCFHYSNMQPLWAKENLAKSDSIIKI